MTTGEFDKILSVTKGDKRNKVKCDKWRDEMWHHVKCDKRVKCEKKMKCYKGKMWQKDKCYRVKCAKKWYYTKCESWQRVKCEKSLNVTKG